MPSEFSIPHFKTAKTRCSQVGHNALGAGQVVDQGARLVDKALSDGSVFDMEGWKYLEPAAKEGTLHLIGLVSDGGVHSRYDQLQKLIRGVRSIWLSSF